MKKQIKKLSLNKRTIANLSVSDLEKRIGGDKTKGNPCASTFYGCTASGKTNGIHCGCTA